MIERFPSVFGKPLGSKKAMLELVQRFRPLRVEDGSELLIYCMLFEVKANKLLKLLPAIGNHELVSHQIPNSKLAKQRADDPYTFSEWKSAAEAVARQPPLESLYQTFTGTDGAVLNAETNSRGGIYIPVVTPAAAKEETPDLTRFFAPDIRSSVKQEQAEDHEHAFVENVDKLSLMLKEMGTLKIRFQDELTSLQQLLNDARAGKLDAGIQPQPRPGFSGSSNPGTSWVMPKSQGSKRLKLKDGSPLVPNDFGPETRYQKIVKYAQSKNWPVLVTLYNDLILNEEDYTDQLGDPIWLYLANVVESSQGRSSNNVAMVYKDPMIESSKGRKTRSQLKDTTHEDEPKPRSLKTVPPAKTKCFDGVHIPVDQNHPNFKNVANQSKAAPEPSNSKDLNGKSNRSNHSSGDASLGKSRSVSVKEKLDKEDSDSEVELVEETSETTRKVHFREPSPSRSDETHRPFDHVPPREVSPIPRNQPKFKPEKVTESKGPSKGPKFRLRNELFIPDLEEKLADQISRQMIALSAAEAFQLSGKVGQEVTVSQHWAKAHNIQSGSWRAT
ncbi:hypothetical protein EV360DRAFT_75732 [Lentinula raphanica]|nr:hypothetical protein EV360DRAFT_75732 [Lentinula raphanica]